MIKNPENAWLGMLIFKATIIPDVYKSPGEILNSYKYRTNLPCINLAQHAYEGEFDKMIERHELIKAPTCKELPKLDVGAPVLCDKNPDSTKGKRPTWHKNLRKYDILTDDSDQIITRSRRHIKAYLTKSGRVNKAPKCLIEK